MSHPQRYRFLTTSAAPRAEALSARVAAGVATIRLYDVIDSWGDPFGISARDVAAALDGLGTDVTELQVHINSPGGECSEGITILNLLRQHPARVVVTVDGLAASAASFVAMAGDEVVMAPNAEVMIHDASNIAFGNAEEMRRMASDLDHLSDNIASIYAARAGGAAPDWRAAMLAETWYSDVEAVAAGLADRVLPLPQTQTAPAAQARARFDLGAFAHAGRANAPAPTIPRTALARATAAAGSTTREEPGDVSDTLITGLRERLGIADDTTDEAAVLIALDEALAERAETPEVIGTPPVVPPGHVVIPAAALADLKAGAAAGVAAQTQLRIEDRERFLDSVSTKFIASSRAAWATEYDRNPAGTRTHFETAPDLLPRNEVGHVGPPEDEAPSTLADITATDLYKNWSLS